MFRLSVERGNLPAILYTSFRQNPMSGNGDTNGGKPSTFEEDNITLITSHSPTPAIPVRLQSI